MNLAPAFTPSFLADNSMLGALAVAALLLGGFYYYCYRAEAGRLKPGQKRLLNILRIVLAVVGLAMMARPAVTLIKEEESLPVVPLLLDESTSMNFPEARDCKLIETLPSGKRTRFESAKEAAQYLQEKLSATHRVSCYLFSDALQFLREVPCRAEDSDAETLSKEAFFGDHQPTGTYSNIGDALLEQLRRLEGSKISGMVLLSDGRQTGGTSLKEAAAFAHGAKVPVHALAFGSEFPLRDLRIDEVIAPPDASLGDVLKLQVEITNQISDPLDSKIELFEDGKSINTQALRLKRGHSSVALYVIPKSEGLHEYRIVLPEYDDEATHSNNTAVVHVKIVKRGMRALLIAGEPSIDYHYLAPALIRDPVVNLSCYLQSADIDYIQQGNNNLERLPATLNDWAEYDVAILYDPDPNKLTTAQIAGLEHLVTKGGGLLVIAGQNFGLGKLVQIHGLKAASLLPVAIDRNYQPNYDRLYEKPFKVRRTPQGKGHPVMFCETDLKLNDQVWATFPDLFWSHPVEGVKPGAVPLLENEKGEVLMAVMRLGEGGVFYSGINSLWLWRYPYGSYDYDRFWTRVIRYLGERKLNGQQKQAALSTDKQCYAPGETVKLDLRILDPALMQQLQGQTVFCAVTSPNGSEYMAPLKPLSDGTPLFRGSYQAQHVGGHLAKVRQIAPNSDSEGKPLFEVETAFQVKLQSLEELDTSADLAGMEKLATETGGKFLCHRDMDRLAELIEAIPSEKQILTQEQVKEFWDGPAVLLLFLALACTEWCLRKFWGVL